MKAAPFEYHRPTSVAEVVTLLGQLDDAKLLAGGQSFVPLLALRLAVFEHLIDVGRVPELVGVERRGDELWIGAATTQATAEHSADVATAVPLLARALPYIGHFQIRNRGTVGGSIAHADPAAELPAVALTLDATLETVSPRGTRQIEAADFFDGTFSTALADDELLTGIRFPIWSGRTGAAVEEVARRHGDFAIAGATVAVDVDPTGTVTRCAIGLLGLGSRPERAHAAEALATGAAATDIDPTELGAAAIVPLGSIPADLNGSADYRASIGAVVVARAWNRAVQEATSD